MHHEIKRFIDSYNKIVKDFERMTRKYRSKRLKFINDLAMIDSFIEDLKRLDHGFNEFMAEAERLRKPMEMCNTLLTYDRLKEGIELMQLAIGNILMEFEGMRPQAEAIAKEKAEEVPKDAAQDETQNGAGQKENLATSSMRTLFEIIRDES